jgi:hypothetical protein
MPRYASAEIILRIVEPANEAQVRGVRRKFEGAHWDRLVCSRQRCNDRRYARLHPVELAAKQRRQYERRKAPLL